MAGSPINSSTSVNLSELAIPLYEVVKRQITEAIMIGDLKAGAVLPSEVALSQTYGVAVGTIRRALMDLTNDGILSRRRKTGTIVTGRKPQHSLRLFFQYFRLHGLDGSLSKSVTKVTRLKRGHAVAGEARKLQIEERAPTVSFHRVRYVDERPIMHETLTLASDRIPDFPEKAEDIPPLFYLHLLEKHGIRISAIREQIGADLATEDDVRWLDLGQPAAVLTIDEVAYDQMAVPVLISAHRATTANHRYVNEVQ
ncbi:MULTISPECIES: GntR family transcriptional regulator [Rhizobium/Agrobacterium group]|uniref:GntR family transcriptional regulator n=1 Tax=Rhizobium/Agrobacterium group TaxID=227290 RepID=UPI0008FB5431|nr:MULTISPECIES: GntR family transcriptional regulator [Rhizobium/Agrobacterium group]MCF1464863.1 GntR family transcriptional regulator [Allorhizobium ampelinum]MCF1496028.1 GntR family transcriptional regulator [Allorhizobium ampelinum]MUZ55535.1 UTRA domain-containing protein [Agrobacterium vitis]MUZ94789.1 UTRA domain-containing protein [Agrobacterium vitis]MVA43137.1 UTRA domain-containing protein [Agrobacterium vitis]